MPTANSEKLRIAAEFYKITCIACHGPDGRGTAIRPAMPTIPDFTAREWQTGRANAQLTATILDGKGTLMPAWRGRVSDDIVPDLIAYVRSFGPADLAANDMPASEFTNRYRELRQRWAVLQQQVSALPAP